MKKLILLPVLALAACTTTGNVEKNAAIGAAIGAATGAVIGNNTGSGDAETGAVIGGVVGAAGGAMVGREKDKAMGEGTRLKDPATGQDLYYDEAAQRYYYVDEQTGWTYWQNGALRSQ